MILHIFNAETILTNNLSWGAILEGTSTSATATAASATTTTAAEAATARRGASTTG